MASSYLKSVIERACKEKFKEVAPKKARDFGYALQSLAGDLVEAEVKSVDGSDISIGSPKITDTAAEIKLSFSSDLHRDSLVPEQYPDGIEDIVRHFEFGWKAKGAVRGYWHGIGGVWSRRARGPGMMLHNAIEAFNAEAPDGVKAELLGQYK